MPPTTTATANGFSLDYLGYCHRQGIAPESPASVARYNVYLDHTGSDDDLLARSLNLMTALLGVGVHADGAVDDLWGRINRRLHP